MIVWQRTHCHYLLLTAASLSHFIRSLHFCFLFLLLNICVSIRVGSNVILTVTPWSVDRATDCNRTNSVHDLIHVLLLLLLLLLLLRMLMMTLLWDAAKHIPIRKWQFLKNTCIFPHQIWLVYSSEIFFTSVYIVILLLNVLQSCEATEWLFDFCHMKW